MVEGFSEGTHFSLSYSGYNITTITASVGDTVITDSITFDIQPNKITGTLNEAISSESIDDYYYPNLVIIINAEYDTSSDITEYSMYDNIMETNVTITV